MQKLHILWTSDNVDTAHKMVFMYAVNSLRKGWWDEVTIIVWGASAKLVAEDPSIQEAIVTAQEEGVHISACIACATHYGIVEKLQALGLEVIPWGDPLTKIIQSKGHCITI